MTSASERASPRRRARHRYGPAGDRRRSPRSRSSRRAAASCADGVAAGRGRRLRRLLADRRQTSPRRIFQHASRLHHRYHRTRRSSPRRVPPRQGLRGLRDGKGQNNPESDDARGDAVRRAVPGDLADLPSLVKASTLAQPDEVYNLGAISFVAMSFNQAELTANITGLGVLRMLEAIRMVGGNENNPIRFYQASAAEMFGKVRETPQTELTPFHPRVAVRLRQGVRPRHHGELSRELRPVRLQRHPLQPRRPAARPRVRHPQGHQRRRPDQARPAGRHRARQPRQPSATGASPATTCKAMWLMLQQDEPEDYVIATGVMHSIEDLV